MAGILPGAYLVAGLLAPARPFTTGFMLAVVHTVIAAVTALIPDYPTEPTNFDVGSMVVAGFVVGLVLGVLATGIVGHVTRWIYLQLVNRETA